jgi:hypothetical protein
VRVARNNHGKPFLNGIDFLEVSPADQTVLVVQFLQNLPGASTSPIPPLPAKPLTKDNFSVTGGVRITGIQVVSAALSADNAMTIKVDKSGDFSAYTLHLSVAASDSNGYDPQLSEIDFSFKINCPSQFDCKTQSDCPPGPVDQPDINYLAKDYESFRRVMLDRMSLLTPNWTERNPADLGVALVELLAYAGDYLSYQQDAIATEAYLGTARKRTSVRRHARLVDYRVHDGSNARVWVQIGVSSDVTTPVGDPPRLPVGTRLLTQLADQPTVIDPSNPILAQALNGGHKSLCAPQPHAALCLGRGRLLSPEGRDHGCAQWDVSETGSGRRADSRRGARSGHGRSVRCGSRSPNCRAADLGRNRPHRPAHVATGDIHSLARRGRTPVPGLRLHAHGFGSWLTARDGRYRCAGQHRARRRRADDWAAG